MQLLLPRPLHVLNFSAAMVEQEKSAIGELVELVPVVTREFSENGIERFQIRDNKATVITVTAHRVGGVDLGRKLVGTMHSLYIQGYTRMQLHILKGEVEESYGFKPLESYCQLARASKLRPWLTHFAYVVASVPAFAWGDVLLGLFKHMGRVHDTLMR